MTQGEIDELWEWAREQRRSRAARLVRELLDAYAKLQKKDAVRQTRFNAMRKTITELFGETGELVKTLTVSQAHLGR